MTSFPSLNDLPKPPLPGLGHSRGGNLADALFGHPNGSTGRGEHDHGAPRFNDGNGDHGAADRSRGGPDSGGPASRPPAGPGGDGPPGLGLVNALLQGAAGVPAAIVKTLFGDGPGFNPPSAHRDASGQQPPTLSRPDPNPNPQGPPSPGQNTPSSPNPVPSGATPHPGSPGSLGNPGGPGVPNGPNGSSANPGEGRDSSSGSLPLPVGGRFAGDGAGGLPQVLGSVVGGVGHAAEQITVTLANALGLNTPAGTNAAPSPTSGQVPLSAASLVAILPNVAAAAGTVVGSLATAAGSSVVGLAAQQTFGGTFVPMPASPSTGYTAVPGTAIPGTALPAQAAGVPPQPLAASSMPPQAPFSGVQTASLPANVASPTQLAIAPGTTTSNLVAGNPLQAAPLQQSTAQLVTDRLSQLPQVSTPPATTMAAASTVAGTNAPAAPAMASLVAAPLAQQPLATDPRAGLPMVASDRAQMPRADGAMLPAGHTGDSQQKRSRRDGQGNDAQSAMSRLMTAISAAGNPLAQSKAEAQQRAERDLERALQWVFWILAIVAYGSLAFTVVALMAGNGQGEDIAMRMQQEGNSWLAIVGLVSGIAAWWVARKLPAR